MRPDALTVGMRRVRAGMVILHGKARKSMGLSDVLAYRWRVDGQTIEAKYRSLSRGDRGVIAQIFRDQDYAVERWSQGRRLRAYMDRMLGESKKPLILDAGANIGASCLFFAQRYPSAHLYAVEPDPNNCAMLRLNTSAVNATVFEGAIGSTPGEMVLENPGRGDWGFMTSRVDESKPQPQGKKVPIVTPNDILSKMGADYFPFIAKIDIEGGEADLFAANLEWLSKFAMVVIELHDWMLPFGGTSSNFLRAVASRNFEFLHRGENVFLFNRDLLANA